MKLGQNIVEACLAACSGIWVNSYEHQYALGEIAAVCEARGWQMATWDAARGTLLQGENTDKPQENLTPLHALTKTIQARANNIAAGRIKAEQDLKATGVNNPTSAAIAARVAADKTNPINSRTVLVMRNFHTQIIGPDRRIANAALLQHLQHFIELGAEVGQHVIVLSYPGIGIPIELEKMLYSVDHELPDKDELWQVLETVESTDKLPTPQSPEAELIKETASGLTRIEAAVAFSLAIVRAPHTVSPAAVWEMKENALKKSGLLSLLKPTSGFEMIGGLAHVKDFAMRLINSPQRSSKARARGILAVGIPGSGKTEFVKALAYTTKLPCVSLNVGTLMGGVVGQTEANTERAFKQVESMSPCILSLEEVEKMLAGAGGGARDSGVSDRLFGRVLSFLSDHRSSIFTVATCNSISELSTASRGAFTRSGRFNAVFFMDLPGREQKDMIWNIWLKHFDLDPEQNKPNDKDWTGADIRECCERSVLLGESVLDTAKTVIPLAVTSSEQIDSLRDFAHNRYLSSDYKGIYSKSGDPERVKLMPKVENGRPRRKVTRQVSN